MTRFDTVGMLTDVPLMNHDIVHLDPDLSQRVQLLRVLLLIGVAKNEVACDGIPYPAGLVGGFRKRW